MNPRYGWARQSAAFVLLLVVWEVAGRAGRLNPIYAPSPSQIAAALVELFRSGRIWTHLEATFTAALVGLALGIVAGILLGDDAEGKADRKSTRLNSSHSQISYAVFCLKKKIKQSEPKCCPCRRHGRE